MIDYENVDGPGYRFQLEAELVPQGLRERGTTVSPDMVVGAV